MSKVDLSPFKEMSRPRTLGAQYVFVTYPHIENNSDMNARISLIKALTGCGSRSSEFKEAADRTYFVAGFVEKKFAQEYKDRLSRQQGLMVHTFDAL
jgi:hypothetical protein